MSLIGRIRKRVRAAAARSRLERDMQEEMREHIAQAAERFRSRGMSEADALIAARREFGNVAVLQEQARDARSVRWVETTVGDLRYAARQIRRTPLLAATIVLTLTLAIGVGAAAIGTVSGIFTRPAPGVPDDKALVAIRGLQGGEGGRVGRYVSYPELLDYARLGEFSDVAGHVTTDVVLDGGGEPALTATARFVTPNYFRALGLRLGAGSGFHQSRVEDHSTPELTAVIGALFARKRYGVSDSALGKVIRVNGVNLRIVGVAPQRFISVAGDGDYRVIWIPISAWPKIDRQPSNVFSDRTQAHVFAVGRLADGSSIAEARRAAQFVASRARAAAQLSDSDSPRSWSSDVVPLRGDLRVSAPRSDDVLVVSLIVAAVVLILLVCTTTVSSLLIGASVKRRQEIAVRLALGASRPRIVRQLLTESALLASVAAVLGLIAFALISRSLHESIRDVNFDPSWTTALLTAGFAIGAAVLCGLSPALHATREAVGAVLKDSATNSTSKTRLQRTFVVAQIALTQPLLLGLAVAVAVVMREGGHAMSKSVNERVVRARFDVWSTAARAENKLPALMQRIAALPGVTAVLPQHSGYRQMKLGIPATGGQVKARTEHVASGYFKTMGITLTRGREFVATDTTLEISPVILGSDFAARAFGDVDPVGKRIPTFSNSGQRVGEVEVVGVVSAAAVGSSEYGGGIRVFAPNGGPLSTGLQPSAMLIRTSSLAAPLIPTLREIAAAEAPLTPLIDMETLAEIEEYTRSEIVEAASASAVGGGIALFLAAIGLYAVVALGVGQRRREIGVRVSLGARPSQVVAMFFQSGLRVSLIGVGIGLPLSAALITVVGSQVGMPRANMPVIGAAVALVVVIVASLASWIPARRAAGVDPLIALRDG